MVKMWASNGEEQKYLETLFRDKKVNDAMKPSEVQYRYPIFSDFTSAIFRKHWNTTKIMFKVGIPGCDGDVIEIDGETPYKKIKINEDIDDAKAQLVCFKQPPVITSVFTDPESKQEKCSVIVSMFSNVKKIDFDIIESESTQVLKITYEWPRASFLVGEMFKQDGCIDTVINKMHPQYLTTEKALKAIRENFEDAPIGSIEITLPAKVQLDPHTWKKFRIRKKDGTLTVFLEFDCHRDDYITSKAQKSLSLE